MVGMLTFLGGAMKGAGDAMVNKARMDREDALNALKRTQAVEDRDAQYAQQDKITDKTEAGANARTAANNATSITTTGMNNQTTLSATAANNATTLKATSMNNATSRDNTAATIAGEDRRTQATLDHDSNTVERVEPIDGKLVAVTKSGQGITVKDDNGAALQTDASLTAGQQRTLKIYEAQHPLLDDDGKPVVDANNRPQTDWNGVVTAMRQAGQDHLADIIEGKPSAVTRGGDNTIDTFVNKGAAVSGGGLLNPSGAAALAPLPVTPPTQRAVPPIAAIEMLRKNPALANYFDQKYGQGAASAALGK